MTNLHAARDAAASFLWGLCKSLVPIPSPSGFILLAAEASRPAAGASAIAVRLLARVVLPGAAGIALGSIPYYLWARRGGRETIGRCGPWLGISRRRIRGFERGGERHRGALVWLLFALPLSPTLLAAVAAGLFEIAPGGYAPLALTGAVARCAALACIGWMFRSRFGDPARFVGPWEVAAAAGIGVAVASWTLHKRNAVMRAARTESSDAA